MKRIIILCALLFSAALAFAGLGNITLTNVGFNGDIGPVGSDATEEGRSWVKIQGKEGSVYRIKPSGGQSENYISEVNLSGSGTVEFHDCDIEGPITLSGDVTVSFIRCTLQSEVNASGHSSGKLTFSGTTIPSLRVGGNHEIVITAASTLKGNVKAETGFTGKFTMTDSTFLTGTAPDLNFDKMPGLTSFVVRNNSGNIGKVLLRRTSLTTFTLQNSGSIGEIDLTEVNNSNVISTISSYKNLWDVSVLKLNKCGLTGAFSIDNAAISELDISKNGITSLTINADHHSNNLKILDASGNSIASADIRMITDSSNPKSTLNLEGNRLGEGAGEIHRVRLITRTGEGTCSSESDIPADEIGTDLCTEYTDYEYLGETTKTGTDEDGNEYEYNEYSYEYTKFILAEYRQDLKINGTPVITYFSIGTRMLRGNVADVASYNNGKKIYAGSVAICRIYKDERQSSGSVSFRFDEGDLVPPTLNLDLSGNEIQYVAGFRTAGADWGREIYYTIRTGKLVDTDIIACFKPCSNGTAGEAWFTYAPLGSLTWNIKAAYSTTGEDTEFAASGTNSVHGPFTSIVPGNVAVMFGCHRYRDWLWGNPDFGGPEMYVYPFGK